MKYKLSHFGYTLPEKLIAKKPAIERDQSKLMVIHRSSGKIEHKTFQNIIDYFDEDDILVVNDTKVFPARMYGNKEKTGARIEVFLLRELNSEIRLWDVLVDPARKIRIGNKLYFGDDFSLVAEVVDNTTSRGRTLRFLFDGDYNEFRQKLKDLGQTPLPKYINREPTAEDTHRYQTVYAQNEGAIAAPTAGLHFSKILLKKMEIKGVQLAPITLHVGLGTFKPVEVEDLSKHKMDSEKLIITQQTTELVNSALSEKKRICAVGTTCIRGLESSVSTQNLLKPFDGWTNRYIFPNYKFSIPNCMITNFHPPKSTLLMLVSAFCGHDLLMNAYQEAIKKKYNFLSYGDCMLII